MLNRVKTELWQNNISRISLLLLVIYSYRCGDQLVYARYAGLNIAEYLLFMVTDHYYLIYVWLFYLAFLAAKERRETSFLERIRFRRLSQYYALVILSRSLQLAAVIFLHLLLPLAIGSPYLKWTNQFILSAGAHSDSKLELLHMYSQIFPTPLAASLAAAVYLLFGSLFFLSVVFLADEIWQKKGALICITLLLLTTMTGFMTDIDQGLAEPFFFNNDLVLHHALFHHMPVTPLLNSLYLAACLLFLSKLARKRKENKPFRAEAYTDHLFAGGRTSTVAFYLFMLALALLQAGFHPGDLIWFLTRGFSYKNFSFTEFAVYLLPPLYMLFFINKALEQEEQSQNALAMFRTESRREWKKLLLRAERRFISLNLTVFLFLMVLLAFLAGLSSSKGGLFEEICRYYSIDKILLSRVLVMSVVFRILEWLILYHIDRLLYDLLKNPVVAYLIPFLFYLPGFLWTNRYPIGKGSAYQLLALAGNCRPGRIRILLLAFILFAVISEMPLLWASKKDRKERK